MTVETLGKGAPDGTNLGGSGEKIGFYGLAAPIAKQSVTQQATATTTALRADIDRINTALAALGLYTVT